MCVWKDIGTILVFENSANFFLNKETTANMAEEKLEAKEEAKEDTEHSIKVYLSGNSGNKEVRETKL